MGPAMRQRAMTGDTCSSLGSGSFAAYLSDNNKYYTPEHEHPSMPTTPVVSDIDDQEEEPLHEAQYPATNAVKALEQLTEGIRIITRQMKQAHAQQDSSEEESDEDMPRERTWSDGCSTIQSCTSQDESRLASILNQLEGTLGANLMSLAHAAQMVGENSRMASQEASESVKDVHLAQELIQQAHERANRAESAVRIMYKKQKELIGQLEQAKKERNVLKRQVKALLQEKSVLKEQAHVARALELHVVSALQAHEKQLALQHAKRTDEKDQPGNVATVRLECTAPDDDAEALDEKLVHEEHFGIDPKQDEKSSEQLESADGEKFVDVVAEKAETTQDVKAATQGPVKQTASSVGLGLSHAIGFVGGIGLRSQGSSRTKKEKSRGLEATIRKLEESKGNANTSKKNMDKGEEMREEPTLISPTNSVENDHGGEAEATREEILLPPSSANRDISIATDGISPCNEANLISPSPTETSAFHRKGFFHRSAKEHRSNKEQRPTKAIALALKKPLLHLDDSSIDVTEGSPDYTSTSETVPLSDTTTSSTASKKLTCDVCVDDAPPKSLSCSTTDQVSPFTHDYATGSATSVWDDHAFRSLAVPSFVAPSARGHVDEKVPLESPTCPPELAEIAAIYAEIGQLHEC